MVRFDKEFRSTFPIAYWKRYEIEFNGQKYPPKMILRLITGLGIAGGGKPINSRFEELGFKVATRDELPDTDTLEGPDEAD